MMAGDEDESSSQSDKNKKKKCEICQSNIRTGGIQCANDDCDVILHVKCFETIGKVCKLQRDGWRCSNCVEGIENTEYDQQIK
ncbi:hypothetical protein NQ318_005949 [Aromia moschata]|uniref:Zinc finger PHD-type domain-containing protein n=1 Tax=Aromia moschata TaxID=1265417 RepID=A0AAV8YF29_9CUCU|nr:hypothetical protein NQ318_005949 [Aromia moschata]